MEKIHYSELRETTVFDWYCPSCDRYNRDDEANHVMRCQHCGTGFELDESERSK